ncbi:MAG: hypothetical protein ABIT05_01865 [Chitinophagaceae bacterium]
MKTKNFIPGNIYLLTIAFLLWNTRLPAQVKESGPITASDKPFYTNLQLKKKEKIEVSWYGYIIVRDARPDNSKMGYVQVEPKARPQRIEFEKGGERFINDLFNAAILPAHQLDTLVIVLNNLWFNETRTAATPEHRLLLGPEKLVSSCYLNADLYRKTTSGLISLGQFDSVVNKKGEWLPANCDKLLERSVKNLLLVAEENWKRSGNDETIYSFAQLDSVIASHTAYPILKTSKPVKGVYLRYVDFLANTPFQTDYDIISDARKTINYHGRAKEDTAWGYSDGENIYMHIANGFYLLNRAQNTFEVLGPAIVEYLNTAGDKIGKMAISYFFSPLRIIDPSPYFEPNKYSIEYYKYFRLNLANGVLY